MNVNRSAAVVSASLLAGLALGLASVIVPVWPRATGIAGGDPDLTALADKADELDVTRERLFHEIDLANHLAAQLAAGTLSLADATGRMEPLLRERPTFAYYCEHAYRVPNTRLGASRYLIGKVERLLESDPTRWASVSARLEAEYGALV